MTDQQKELIARYVANTKNGNLNSYRIALKIWELPTMVGVLIPDIEAEILRICPQFNCL